MGHVAAGYWRAMSEQNVETVRIALSALDQRDVDGYLRVASPEIEVINPASEIEGAAVGHAGMRRVFAETGGIR
jgi:ketosteroid isomerase-like protein